MTVPALAATPLVGGLADAIFESASEAPDRIQLSRRTEGGEWQDVTTAGFRDEVTALARGLLAEGIRFGDRVAVMSRTRYEWTLLDFALWTVGAQPVPVYPTASAEQLGWILRDSGAVACVIEHEDHAMTLGSVLGGPHTLAHVWQLDAGAMARLTEAGQRIPEDLVHRHRLAVTPDAVATVIYTSGTTGRPQGCVLTHANFMTECDNLIAGWRPIFDPGDGGQSSTLLFLPLAHVFGRMVQVASLRAGVRLAHQPDMSAGALLPDLATFRPTFVLGVPYVFERVFGAARAKAEQEGHLAIFDRAVEVAVRFAEARERRAFGEGPGPGPALRLSHRFYDRLVYGKVRDALGGRVRSAVSGGSTMGRRLSLFFDGAGVTVYEGYGLTESTSAATCNPPGRVRHGTVGCPVPGTDIRIIEDGEILLRGGSVFTGYLGDPGGTAEALHDGWLHTGDLGSLDREGYLTITGRKKELIVTASGKNLLPGLLEARVREHPLVDHCVVIGNDRPYVVALVTLDSDAVAHWLRLRGRPGVPDPDELSRDPALEAEVRRAVSAANTQVSKAESIRAFRILPFAFTEDCGLLTPSRKLKRRSIEQVCSPEIETLYGA